MNSIPMAPLTRPNGTTKPSSPMATVGSMVNCSTTPTALTIHMWTMDSCTSWPKKSNSPIKDIPKPILRHGSIQNLPLPTAG
ncbi:UNVERIFIED_CONTAM: hypothetical protein GTU68_033190 [Idotea baltica]|nr:hypothetical protein [Idotea baltica]